MAGQMSGEYGSPRRPDFTAPGHPGPAGPAYPPPLYGPSGPRIGAVPTSTATGSGGMPGPAEPSPAAAVPRPPMVTLSMVLIIAGSLLWMTALGFIWIFVYVARDSFGYAGAEGAIYHMLERFHLRMIEGLAAVLFGAPSIAVVLSFFLLLRRSWPRIAISVLGVVTIVVTAVVLSGSLLWVLPGGAYIAFACLILWTPAVSRWCATGATPPSLPYGSGNDPRAGTIGR
jgi:hypothetical protein